MAREPKEKPGIMVYWEMFDVLESLVDGDAKTMLHAMRNYSQYGEIPDFKENVILRTLWKLVKPKIDADTERYERVRQQRIDAINKRWGNAPDAESPTDSEEYGSIQEYTNEYKCIQENTEEYGSIRSIPTATTTTTTTTTPEREESMREEETNFTEVKCDDFVSGDVSNNDLNFDVPYLNEVNKAYKARGY